MQATDADALEVQDGGADGSAGGKRKSSRMSAGVKQVLWGCGEEEDMCEITRQTGGLSLPTGVDVPFQGCFCAEGCRGQWGEGCSNALPVIDSEACVEVKTGEGGGYGRFLTAKKHIAAGEIFTIFGGVTVKRHTHALAFDMLTRLYTAQQAQEGGRKFEYSAQPGSAQMQDSQAWLIPPQDVPLLQDLLTGSRYSNSELKKLVREQTEAQGLGQYAQHTCCPKHVNAYLFPMYILREGHTHKRVKGSKRYSDDVFMDLQAFALRAQKDIQIGKEILVHYVGIGRAGDFHKIFKCACCRCAGGCVV